MNWTGKQERQTIKNTGDVAFWIGKGENRREVKPGETVELLPGDIEFKSSEPMRE